MAKSRKPERPEFDRDRDIGYGQNVPMPDRDIGGNPLPSIEGVNAGANVVPGRSAAELMDYQPPETIDPSIGGPIPQGLIDAGVAEEEARSKEALEEEKARRDLQRRTSLDPTVRPRRDGTGDVYFADTYPEEVESWMARNKTQEDVKREKYAGGDVPFDAEVERDMRLYTLKGRQQREALASVAEGSGLSGMAASEFAQWKASGGKWGKPYGQVSREALRAASNYYQQFGTPKSTAPAPQRETLAAPSFEEFQRQTELGMRWDAEKATFVPRDEPLDMSGYSTDMDRAEGRSRANDERLRQILQSEADRAGSSVEEIYGQSLDRFSPEELREEYREIRNRRRAQTGRRGAIRSINRRDPADRKAALDRANRNLPPGEKILAEEVGLPSEQARGQVRRVEGIDEVSLQTAIDGEILSSPEGQFIIDDGRAVRAQRMPSGGFVPDADSLDFDDFKGVYNGEMRRSVATEIRRSGNNSFSRDQRNIEQSRARISRIDRDNYSDEDRRAALARLNEQEKEMHYQYLQEQSPGTSNPQSIRDLPQQTMREMQSETERINAETRRDLAEQRNRGGTGGSGTQNPSFRDVGRGGIGDSGASVRPSQIIQGTSSSVSSASQSNGNIEPIIIRAMREAGSTKGADIATKKRILEESISMDWDEIMQEAENMEEQYARVRRELLNAGQPSEFMKSSTVISFFRELEKDQ